MRRTPESWEHEIFTDVELPLGGRRNGKVRVSFDLDATRKLFVTTDRLSAFDQVIGAVPSKGEVLNRLSWWWFQSTRGIVDNHAISLPDPNALVAISARPLKIEVVVRGHITGVTSTSLWRQYESGARTLYGHRLPDGLRKNDRLPRPIITPTTKADAGGHDMPLTFDEVVSQGLVSAGLWEEIGHVALSLFSHGERVARNAGIILCDTKYEFGLDPDGRLLLIDEIHTPDSSRFWDLETFEDRHGNGLEPVSLDKEIIRRALAEMGYTGEGEVPPLEEKIWLETSRGYVDVYERLTNERFQAGERPVAERLSRNIERFLDSSGDMGEVARK